MGARTKHGTWVKDRSSALSGTAVVSTIYDILGRQLDRFDQLLINLKVTTALVGTDPTMSIYPQRAVVPSPDPAEDTHWEDICAFGVTTTVEDQIVTLPITHMSIVAENVGAVIARPMTLIGAGAVRVGHWGDRIRIMEKMGGTVTTAAVYSIYATGILRTAE